MNVFTKALNKARELVRKGNANKPSKHDIQESHERRNFRTVNYFYVNPFLNRKQRQQAAGNIRNGGLSKEQRKTLGDMLRNEPRNVPYFKAFDENGVQLPTILRRHAGLATPARLIFARSN